MKDKNEKKKDFELLKKTIEENQNIFVTGYEKLTVGQDFELNNIAEKAAEGTQASNLLADLKGMTSLAYTSGDPVALAKALTNYAKTNAAFTFKAGMVEGRVIDVAAINDLANMPAKEQIYAQLLYLINATATRLVTCVNGVGRNLAVVVDQGVKENKFQQ
jgi:large subunit ribosomal protein L10